MDEFNIPIFRKSFDLYRAVYDYRKVVPKQDRYTIWQRLENFTLEFLEGVLVASQTAKPQKLAILERSSLKLNMVRIFLRLTKETKALDNNRYVTLQTEIDQIGKMLGGWIKSTKNL